MTACCRVDEVFSWLLEVEHDTSNDMWNEEAHIIWTVHYIMSDNHDDSYFADFSDPTATPSGSKSSQKAHPSKNMERIKHKISARFEVRKDITQAVLPVSKVSTLCT